MILRFSIRILAAAALPWVAGCTTSPPPMQRPLAQDDLDRFLAGGRDARYSGITIYPDAAGTRFEFANRVHPGRSALVGFASPRNPRVPVIRARTAGFVDFNLLLDSSARQNWLLLPSVKAMDYRPFAPPMGEYADHIVADIPGYAGVANKIVMQELHVESPVFYVPPAQGSLGPWARAAARPEGGADPQAARARQALGAKTHAVMGAALMRAFAFIRFDFPERTVRFSTHAAYQPAAPSAVRACLPLRDWKGRPAVQGIWGNQPITLVIDTAGDFDVAAPGPDLPDGPLVLGRWQIDDVRPVAHGDLGLPDAFPARLGLGVLSRGAVILDFKRQQVWFEGKALPAPAESASSTEDEDPAPVHYRGITR